MIGSVSVTLGTDYNPVLFAYGFLLALIARSDWMDLLLVVVLFVIVAIFLVELLKVRRWIT